ncbi:MAG: hypothetical protein U0840_05780 [Gemmataceae bacterium]
MEQPEESDLPSQDAIVQRLARYLRHEMGDLLQAIYSTIAVLVERLPNDLIHEKRLLKDLKGRAELCKIELDALVQLVSPQRVSGAQVDLAALVSSIVVQVRRRFPALEIDLACEEEVTVFTDIQATMFSAAFLLTALGNQAQKKMEVNVRKDGISALWEFSRDGYPVGNEQIAWISTPFTTTQQSMFGLSLSLLGRTLEPFQGTLAVNNGLPSGVRVLITLPLLDR